MIIDCISSEVKALLWHRVVKFSSIPPFLPVNKTLCLSYIEHIWIRGSLYNLVFLLFYLKQKGVYVVSVTWRLLYPYPADIPQSNMQFPVQFIISLNFTFFITGFNLFKSIFKIFLNTLELIWIWKCMKGNSELYFWVYAAALRIWIDYFYCACSVNKPDHSQSVDNFIFFFSYLILSIFDSAVAKESYSFVHSSHYKN